MVCEFSKTCNRYSPKSFTCLHNAVTFQGSCMCKRAKKLAQDKAMLNSEIERVLTAICLPILKEYKSWKEYEEKNVNSSFSKQEFTLNRQETTGKSTPNKQGEMVKNIDSKT